MHAPSRHALARCLTTLLGVELAVAVTFTGCFSDPLGGPDSSTNADQSESGSETEGNGPGELGPVPIADDIDDGQIYVDGGRYMWL